MARSVQFSARRRDHAVRRNPHADEERFDGVGAFGTKTKVELKLTAVVGVSYEQKRFVAKSACREACSEALQGLLGVGPKRRRLEVEKCGRKLIAARTTIRWRYAVAVLAKLPLRALRTRLAALDGFEGRWIRDARVLVAGLAAKTWKLDIAISHRRRKLAGPGNTSIAIRRLTIAMISALDTFSVETNPRRLFRRALLVFLAIRITRLTLRKRHERNRGHKDRCKGSRRQRWLGSHG